MAGFNECVAKIVEAAGESLSKREAAELLRKFNDTTKHLSTEQRVASLREMMDEFQANMVQRNQVYGVFAKQTELLHAQALQTASARMDNAMKGGMSVKAAVDTLLYGHPGTVGPDGARVAGRRDGLVTMFEGTRTRFNTFLAGRLQEMGLLGHWHDEQTLKSAIDVAFDHTAQVNSQEAQQIGNILAEANKLGASRLNKAGAYVLPTPRVLFNSKVANPAKVAAMGKQAFIDMVNGLELDKSFFRGMEDTEIEKYLGDVYDKLSKGGQYQAPTGNFDGIGGLTKERYRNLANSNSLDVDIPFATADAFKQFAAATSDEPLTAFITRRMDQIGRSVGLMENFGPAPERFLDDLMGKYADKMSDKDKSFLLNKGVPITDRGKLTMFTAPFEVIKNWTLDAHPADALAEMLGKTSNPADPSFAAIGRGLRNWASMASLGQGVFAQLTDLPIRVAQVIKYGQDPFEALMHPLTQFAELLPTDQQKQFYTDMGLAAETMVHTLAENTSGGSKVMDTYFKLNGMAWPDIMGKRFTASYMARSLGAALERGEDHAILDLFRSYGFTEAEFEKMKGALGNIPGLEGKVIDPRALESVDGKLFERYLSAMQDIVNTATPTPGVRERAISNKGTRAGTLGGEALRIAMQFKNYPSMLINRVYPSIRYEHGIQGRLATMASMLAFYYIGDSMKQLSQGKTPQSLANPANMASLMVRSGMGGIYSDMMLHDYSRNGMGLADLVAGPVTGRIGDLASLGSAAVQGKATPVMAAQKISRAMPNVFLTKTVLEHTLIHAMMEMSNPGSVARSYARLKKETGQERLF
ncbi:MAG TPA: hypothetical protein VN081_03895 [Dongiaceae bacterium]|nr:hypothetical protein [Dongiaceae bacterium]